MQNEELKSVLMGILNGDLIDNCIEEIVTFCIGKVNKFNVKDEEKDCVIDESQHVGSKRCISVNTCKSRKRRRLE